MTLATSEFEFSTPGAAKAAEAGPAVETAHWGYAIHDGRAADGLRRIMAGLGRFVGSILMLAAVGLWILPDTVAGAELFSMKLAAMVMFSVFGGYLLWAGSTPGHLEYHVDVIRGELRVGRRDLRGGFRHSARLTFDDIASVYLLRSKDHAQPARLYLRLAGSDGALEVARGPEAELDPLRDRLTRDLSRNPRQPVEAQLAAHGRVAT